MLCIFIFEIRSALVRRQGLAGDDGDAYVSNVRANP